MEGQTLLFSQQHPFGTPAAPLYSSYHTPPYSVNTASSSWPEYTYHYTSSMSEDVLQMQQQQQLRFPTPPITPPRNLHPTVTQSQRKEDLSEAEKPTAKEPHQPFPQLTPQRTQSVIMKIGHDQSPHHLPAETYNDHLDHHIEDNHNQNHHDTPSSGTSSPSSTNDFICDWIDCGRCFESLEFLAIHVTQIHAVASLTDGLYYCRWSGCHRTQRGFNARYKMLVHVRTHTKEKPHQCHLCDKRFSRAENLKIHIRSHSGEKPYICTFEGCNKAYSNSSDRFKHTRTHSMEKPYMCKVPGCQKRYTDPSSLRKHVKTFKHSVQIMDSKTTTTPPPSAQQLSSASYIQQSQYHNLQQRNSLDESRFSPLEQNDSHYPPSYHLIMTAAPTAASAGPDSFCMAMEEMCHIRATLDCYKTNSTNTDADNYWLHDEPDSKSSHFHTQFHHSSLASGPELTLDLTTTDKPLDLTIKRFSS
ncbi:zinc finger protein GLIS2 homolog [Musca vetustissima]|uniref:zinc finger protein GLIS2 homolog n=1 Tax=Musca vetustissima TaxID=27455 RepID=UPI002AB7CDEC|nr:zinc finger protein GLIS2 homolog [Musca vetustissima]